ncbi:AI-2E family transporter [Aliidiomarina sp.]|uniref:AI-2E family transporter n=1 Tax=Aliidiomarina sp. TaxID=1872439 RepID=UPI003A4D7BCA
MSNKPERTVSDLATPIYGLFILAILYTFYLAHEVILPVVLAILVTLLFSPIVEILLKRFRIPKAISSLFLLLGLVAGIAGISFAISGPLLQWAERAPSTVSELLVGESEVQQGLRQITDTAEQIEEQIEEQLGDDAESAQTVVLQTDSWRSQLTSGLYQTAAGVTLALALTYFLLVSGDRMLLNLAAQLSRQKRAIMLSIVRNGQEQISPKEFEEPDNEQSN